LARAINPTVRGFEMSGWGDGRVARAVIDY